MFKNISLIVLSVVFFFFGNRLGELRTNHEEALCNQPLPAVATESVGFVSPAADSGIDSASRCTTPNAEDRSLKQKHLQGSCRLFPANNASSLQRGSASVSAEVFPFLHHPSSPAKVALFMSQQPFSDQEAGLATAARSPCQEIYLTRTGSRASQPNKCVSVVVVPEGSESPIQQSHRVSSAAVSLKSSCVIGYEHPCFQ